jgi:hypothetical protein
MNQPIEMTAGPESESQNLTGAAAAAPGTPLRGDAGEEAHGAECSLFKIVTRPRLALAIIFAVGVLLFIVNLGGYPMYSKGEPREAVTVFDIVHGGGIILPMRAGVEIPSEPLLMHWIAALVSIRRC